MLKKINKLQEELLKVNNYFVLPELYVIKDNNSADRPLFNIYFDPNAGEFGLQVFPVVIQDERSMHGFRFSLWSFKMKGLCMNIKSRWRKDLNLLVN